MYIVYPDPNQDKVFYQIKSWNGAVSLQHSLTLMGYESPAITSEAEYDKEPFTFTSDVTLKDVREASGLLIGSFVMSFVLGGIFYFTFSL